MTPEELTQLAAEELFDRIKPRDNFVERYLVRFWSLDGRYEKFSAICKARDIFVQDAFNEFMDYYIERAALAAREGEKA